MTSSELTKSSDSASRQRVAATTTTTLGSSTSSSSSSQSSSSGSGSSSVASTSGSSTTTRSNARRRSYADWITRAIQSSPDERMTLASIYNWMASNVPGLYEKRNLHSSKGWKNAVRHTLSVNRRFQKISQPNIRAALWTVVPPPEIGESSSEQPKPTPEASTSRTIAKLELPSCSTLFSDSATVTTCVVASALPSAPSSSTVLLSSPPIASTSTSYLFPNSAAPSLGPDLGLTEEPIVTQTLELHHQDGTVRTVTVPKPFPIHVVGDYRVVTVDPKPFLPHVVTSG